jgi:L-rhamnose-H+ transport protein
VLAEAPRESMKWSFLLGMLYGIGGTAFGIAIRYIGFSLTYAIAVGLSGVLGTIIPPIAKGIFAEVREHPGEAIGQYVQAGLHSITLIAEKTGGAWVLFGIAVGTVGIGLCGWAGRSKERDLGASAAAQGFSLTKGLLISLLAGVLSAVYGFSLEAGQPIADVAAKYGADYWQGNVIYPFSNTGAFITTAIYCIYLGLRHKSMREFVELPASEEQPSLPINFAMAVLTGCLWYGQFFFYNLGHVRMGKFQFSSWAIHMTMLVLISNVVGMILLEWAACRPQTRVRLHVALTVLVGAVALLTYGNYLGEQAAAH